GAAHVADGALVALDPVGGAGEGASERRVGLGHLGERLRGDAGAGGLEGGPAGFGGHELKRGLRGLEEPPCGRDHLLTDAITSDEADGVHELLLCGSASRCGAVAARTPGARRGVSLPSRNRPKVTRLM